MIRLLTFIGRAAAGTDVPRGPAVWSAMVVIVSTCLLVVAAARAPASGNPSSRLASIESLVDYADWSLNESVFRYETVDKVGIGGRYYSSKPPVYSALGAAIYGLLSTTTSVSFRDQPDLVLGSLRLLMQVCPFLLGLFIAGRFSRRHTRRDWAWAWGFTAFGLGTFVFGYSATINNHSLAALLMLVGLAFAVEVGAREQPMYAWLGAGIVTATAVTLDFGATPFAVGLTVYLLVTQRDLRIAWFFLGAALPAVIHFHLTYRLTGSFQPFYAFDFIYKYPGSYWLEPGEFDALKESRPLYTFHATLGHHGLFAMTPLFLFAVPGTVMLARTETHRSLGWLIAFVACTTVGTYLLRGPFNYGGMAMGMRWFIVVTPLLWFTATRYVDEHWESATLRISAVVCVLLGIAHAVPALAGPWDYSWWNQIWRHLGAGSVPL